MDPHGTSVAGYRAEITCADGALLIKRICDQNIVLEDVVCTNDLSYTVCFKKSDLETIRTICQKSGAELKILSNLGVLWIFRAALRRPVLLIGCLLLLVISYYLPRYILFVRVEGNSHIPTAQIVEAAEVCGVRFGSARKNIRSEQIKNSMLQMIPQLRWVGVNTSGCVAVIKVTEREEETVQPEFSGASKIVAVRDGVISSCTVTSGTLLCSPGQVVKEGQTLVSGLSQTGVLLKGTRSSGEIYGSTTRQIRAVMPLFSTKKGETIGTVKNISIIIGKLRINFNNNSRISGAICGKMYKEYYMTLPGGYQLPFGVAVEECCYYESVAGTSIAADESALKLAARRYLSGQMLSGEIRFMSESLWEEDGLLCVTGQYICHELIGREQTEEMITEYGKDH